MCYTKYSVLCFVFAAIIIVGCGSNPPQNKKKASGQSSANISVAQGARVLSDKSDSVQTVKTWSWEDYNRKVQSIEIKLSKQGISASAENRKRLKISPMVKNCPDYFMLREFDAPLLKPLSDDLSKIAEADQLDQQETAALVITMVQNIPYTLVHPYTHEKMEEIDSKSGTGFIKQYHSEESHLPLNQSPYGGCADDVGPAGIYSPVEFLSGFRGDCDTRTVTIHTLLKNMGIPSIVTNGPGHSMLALPFKPSNPAAPFLVHNGVKYYFLETTVFYNNQQGTGPRLGDVPKNFDASQWFPVLY
jgi:hypothetical protein